MKRFLFIALILFTVNVKAEIDCNKLMEIKHECTAPNGIMNVNPGEELICTIKFNSLESELCNPNKETLKEISFNLNKPDELSILDVSIGNGFTKSGIEPIVFKRTNGINSGTIYTYKIKTVNVDENTTYNLVMTDIFTKNDANNYIENTLYGENITFRVLKPLSKINTLDELNVSKFNLTPEFSKDILNYTLTIDKNVSKVNISAIKTDELSIISGDIGEKKLNFGTNTFKINVKSESGIIKTYTVIVTREDFRSDENGLMSLTVSDLYFDFKPEILRYDLEVDKEISTVTIKSILIDPKSSYIKGSENFTKSLIFGTNRIEIKVKAENEEIKTYVVNIVRNDGKSSVNSLSNLTIIGHENLIDFIPETLVYNIKVSSIIKEIAIDSKMTSTKSTYIPSFGNRKVLLNPGLNKIEIKVKSEKGIIKTYTINIIREDPKDNTNLKSLKINIEDFEFDKDKFEYDLEISNLVKKLNIEAVPEEKSTKVNIIGNENLKIGKNTIKIEIVSLSGKKKEYTLLVNKRDKASTISKLRNITIKDYNIDFDINTFEYVVKIKDEEKLDISVEKLDPLTKYSVFGNNNLKYGSIIKIIASAEDGTTTEYKIRIIKDINPILLLGIVTFIIIIITIISTRKNKSIKLVKKKKVIRNRKKHTSITVEPKPLEDMIVEPVIETTPIQEPVPEIPIVEEKKEEEILEI